MRAIACLVVLPSLCAALAACGSSHFSPAPEEDGGAADAGTAADTGSGSHDSGSAPGEGGLPDGSVGANGGTISQLYFAVTGDSRPPSTDDVLGYPTAIITKIYQDIEALSPPPPFVIGTGDYQDSSTHSSSTASQQIPIYMHARAQYSGTFFPAMGNHECTGADDSNCGTGNQYGITPNLQEFLTGMLGPIQKTLPYYVIHVNAPNGSWTAKFVITAANAWDTDQQTWLGTALAEKTTYTFVVRHEPSTSSGNPAGVAAIDTVMAMYPYTMLLVGHSHEYGHPYRQVALFGNGGAPPTTTGQSYGFGVFKQRADGAIVVDAIDYMTGAADPSFHFVITADGLLTQ
jgi:hypothetical protein